MSNLQHKIYGLLGYPAKHSLSPLMHNAAFSALGLDAEYKIFEVPPQDLDAFFSNLYLEGIYGLNITIPYKEKVLGFLNEISKETQLIGAVNTIRVLGKRLAGFNTDGEGFIRHLTEDLNFNPKDKVISILGAGGAGKAVSVFLSKYRPRRISIYDINLATAIALVGRLKSNFKYTEFRVARSVKELG
ncbi:MAG: shikimate dehydrogenase, partial [Candidatus Omnitrophica bacterium]|nr:shikimate dehydrogenase [Candidatus Omnitrophota bacterium]